MLIYLGGIYFYMQLELGTVLEGKVTGITKFGAFVDLGEGKTGMVHISEVAPAFVSEIRDYLTENQVVKVKVINITEDGKIGLSIRKAMEVKKTLNEKTPKKQKNNMGWQGPKKSPEPKSFEDMMSRFKQASDEKISDLKRCNESKRGGGFSRRSGHSR